MISFLQFILLISAGTAGLTSATKVVSHLSLQPRGSQIPSTVLYSHYHTHLLIHEIKHVNEGCVHINGDAICAPAAKEIDNGQATINAGYKDGVGVATLKLDATWDKSWGDVYYGANNCLYQSGGKLI